MEKINVAELLKDCPQGMELDCAMYNSIEFDYIEQSTESAYPIHCLMKTNEGYVALVFTYNGCNDRHPNAKCVIFPKGKTTWEGFVPPVEFKDGDILCNSKTKQPFILKFFDLLNNNVHSYCGIDGSNKFYTSSNNWAYASDVRLATKEEKAKLFKAIKDNGYNWNEETKTLEKFVQPKFKVGDIVSTRNGMWIGIVKKPVGGACETYVTIYGDSLVYNDNIFCFERFATEEEKEKLFKAIKDNGYNWNEETKTLEKFVQPKFKVGDKIRLKNDNDNLFYKIINIKNDYYVTDKGELSFPYEHLWELVPNKFDIKTLIPFESKVLVRNDESQYWIPAFWGYKRDDGYTTTFGWSKYCVPFYGNEHLLEKPDDCAEYFKTWK